MCARNWCSRRMANFPNTKFDYRILTRWRSQSTTTKTMRARATGLKSIQFIWERTRGNKVKKKHTVKVINTRLTLFRHSCRVCCVAIYVCVFKAFYHLIDENDDLIFSVFFFLFSTVLRFSVCYTFIARSLNQFVEKQCPIWLVYRMHETHIDISAYYYYFMTKIHAKLKRSNLKEHMISLVTLNQIHIRRLYSWVNLVLVSYDCCSFAVKRD